MQQLDPEYEYDGVFESSEFSKKIYALEETIQTDIENMRKGTLTDAIGFLEKLKNYRFVALTWNNLYSVPESEYDVNKYSKYEPTTNDSVEKPKRIF